MIFRKIPLDAMSVDQLVERFAAIAVAQDNAILGRENAKFNRLYDRMKEVSDELKGRLGDQRRELVRLFTYPNIQVQLKAAIHTLAVAPEAAQNQLKTIADLEWYPQTADARGMLRGLVDGSYVPT